MQATALCTSPLPRNEKTLIEYAAPMASLNPTMHAINGFFELLVFVDISPSGSASRISSYQITIRWSKVLCSVSSFFSSFHALFLPFCMGLLDNVSPPDSELSCQCCSQNRSYRPLRAGVGIVGQRLALFIQCRSLKTPALRVPILTTDRHRGYRQAKDSPTEKAKPGE